MVSKVRSFTSSNVVAMLPGSDPRLKNEAVLYTAHYDHLGIRPDMPGDNIYNGAMDNATGCGILLELARAYASAAQRPKRSILFAAVTAEEQGLRGSEYLGQHPPIPAGKIALDLNYDDLPRAGHCRRSAGRRRRAHQLVSHRGSHGAAVRAPDPSRSPSRIRPLLPLRPLQPGPRGHSFVQHQGRGEVQGTHRASGARSRTWNTSRSAITSPATSTVRTWTSAGTR